MYLVPAASARLGGISVLFSEGRCNRSVQVHRLADAWTRTDLPPKSLLSCLVLHEKSAYIDVHIDLCHHHHLLLLLLLLPRSTSLKLFF